MASTLSSSSTILPLKRARESPIPAQREVSPPAPATSQRFKNSIVLAPMVRSGTMPTRLLALKHGASLVWGPEIVDRAMLHAKRVVDEKTGIVSFEGTTSSIWSCHPAERPYLIYQIGSSTPSLAVAAALLVSRDVSGVDLNCGCPKPFSTSGGMGAALLDTPDILCEILTSLRKALPAHISVSCKIRLLPDQGKTLELVKRIVKTGINCLTVHCRTRSMRKGEKAIIERLKEIVDFVHGMKDDNGNPLDIAVLANGDVEGWHDMMRVRDITGADGVMIATKAEENPTCFSEQMLGVEDLVVTYLKIAKYSSNAFGNTKHCISSFKSAPGLLNQKSTLKVLRNLIASAKDYEGLCSLVRDRHDAEVARGAYARDFDEETWGGEYEVEEFVKSIKARGPPAWWVGVEEWERLNPDVIEPEGMSLDENGIKELLEREKEERPRKKSKVDKGAAQIAVEEMKSATPSHTTNPEVATLGTPGPIFATYVPPLVAGRNERSPSPERPVSNPATLVG
ncbi:FMN-linked oxidoreductase [Serendipita vermifera]|nr:FMN-linked oxidoreductase [Serendipita vermifera]